MIEVEPHNLYFQTEVGHMQIISNSPSRYTSLIWLLLVV